MQPDCYPLSSRSNKRHALALLMIHASGMTREDFMADYPRKTSGLMETVHGQNVHNYHWEFYREMNDVRNDVGTAFSRKNPFAYRIGFGSAPAPFATNEWHKAQIVKISHKTKEGGYTLVPLQIYFLDGRAKVEIAVAKGKREYDKRQTLRERQDKREADRAISSKRHLGE